MESLDTHLVLEHWLVSEDTPQPHNQSWPKTQFKKKKTKKHSILQEGTDLYKAGSGSGNNPMRKQSHEWNFLLPKLTWVHIRVAFRDKPNLWFQGTIHTHSLTLSSATPPNSQGRHQHSQFTDEQSGACEVTSPQPHISEKQDLRTRYCA